MLILLQKIKINKLFADISPENRKVFLVCLGISFVFWILVKLSKEYTARSHVHISYELPFGSTFTTAPPSTIALDLKAKGWYFFLSTIRGREPKLVYQIPDGMDTYALSVIRLREDLTNILKDKQATIVNLHFDGATAVLEKQANKRLPLTVPTDIHFAAEYDLATPIKLQPDSITIVGPKSRLKFLTVWPTDTLKLRDLNQNYTGKITIAKPTEGFSLSLESTDIFVNVEKYTGKYIHVPIQLTEELTDSIRFFPDEILLKCEIGLSYYNDLSASDFVLKADLNQHLIEEGKNTVALKLIKQPSYVRSVHFSPKVASFFIIKVKE